MVQDGRKGTAVTLQLASGRGVGAKNSWTALATFNVGRCPQRPLRLSLAGCRVAAPPLAVGRATAAAAHAWTLVWCLQPHGHAAACYFCLIYSFIYLIVTKFIVLCMLFNIIVFDCLFFIFSIIIVMLLLSD